jgi:hypothetical protein
MGNEKLVSFEGVLRLLQEKNEWQQKVEVKLLNSKINRNNWQYLNLEKHRKLFAETPILVAYKGKQIGDGHNYDEVYAEDGSVYASFMSATSERIVGWFKSEEDIRLETIDDTEWVIGTGYIWTWYAQELVAKLNGQGVGDSEMSVSIETLIDEMHMDGDTEVFTKYKILGTTILGDAVAPAVADASIRVLSAIGTDKIHDMTLRVASLNEEGVRVGEANPQSDEDGADPNVPNGIRENETATAKANLKKGKRPMRITSDIRAKFSDFSVLAMNGEQVVLGNAENEVLVAGYKRDNGEVIADEPKLANASVVVGEGDEAVDFALAEIRANDAEVIADLTAKLASAEAARDEAKASLADMERREHQRRVEAVKNAISKRFEEIRNDADIAIDEAECEKLLADDKVECYAKMEDEEGEFCGDVKACADVDSICMKAYLEAKKVQRANSAHKFVFEVGQKEPVHSDVLDGAIERISK